MTYDKQPKMVLRVSRVRIAVLIISVICYLLGSVGQWKTIVAQEKVQLQRMASVLNNELEYVVQNSYNVLSNPYIIQLLAENQSVNMADNLEFLNILDLFFLNYANSTTADRPAIVIYHDNEYLFENRYLHSLDRLNDQVYQQLEQLERGNGLWENKNGQLYYYRPFYQKSVKAYLEYHVDNSILERHIRHVEDLQSDKHILYDIGDQGDKSGYRVLEEELISGTRITISIPYAKLKDIYIHNLFLITAIVITILLLLRYRAMKTFNKVASNINVFADAIMTIEPMGEVNYLPCDVKDEMYPIYSKINELINSINVFRQEKQRHEREKLELKINLLQSKLNPHLLFNSLSVLQWKLMKIAPDLASDVSVLSRYFRDALSGENYAVELKEEIDLEKEYVAVMEVLNNRKYCLSVDVEEELLHEKTMKLILQPFVENAVLHGLQSVENPIIHIAGVKTDEGYQIRVEDNGSGIPKKKLDSMNDHAWDEINDAKRKSYGIRNSFERMKLFYAQQCVSRIESLQGKGTKVILDIKKSK